jgi:hypothetical protein
LTDRSRRFEKAVGEFKIYCVTLMIYVLKVKLANCLIRNVREEGIVASYINVREVEDTDLLKLATTKGGGLV